MSFTITNPAIAEYVILCEEHLRDLPAPVAGQLRHDIEEIVTEVCGELDGAPQDLVGPPLRFVTDLRTAAGLAPPPAAIASSDAGEGDRRLRDRMRSLWEHRAVQWVRHLAPELRPAWWVGRGYVLAVALGRLTGANLRPSWLLGFLPYWSAFGSRLLGLVAIAGAVYLSVEAGRRPLAGRQRALRAAASVIAVAFALVLLGEARSWSDNHAYESSYLHYPPAAQPRPAPTAPGQAALVTIGSSLTGNGAPVIDLTTALQTVDSLLVESPPAAIFIEHNGTQGYPGTRAAIESELRSLAERGLLNE